jgi:hypothetical protein
MIWINMKKKDKEEKCKKEKTILWINSKKNKKMTVN